MAGEHRFSGLGRRREYALHLSKKKIEDRYFIADEAIDLSDIPVLRQRPERLRGGRLRPASPVDRKGHLIRTRPRQPGEPAGGIDLNATLTAAALRSAAAGKTHLTLTEQDLRQQVRVTPARRLVIFAVDTSDSMGDGPEARMRAALGAALTLADQAYLNRDRISLITFRDRAARLVVPPTDSVTRLRRHLQRLPVGGSTPLAAGLEKALQLIRRARARDPQLTPLLVLISDGDATVGLTPGSNPRRDCLDLAAALREAAPEMIVIDTLTGGKGPGFMPSLAEALGTACHHIHNLRAGQVIDLIERTRQDH